ncbi:hypothetical protein AGLY_015151 [Aphis glycines]|uniref:Uncharacterized protein n=1 Tax=Aphis glycines TaxID=307491 RepID=A0A6G0T1A6_APHGL|nr:hypothetical protein AGLY_015151 [Aphis glycines]
MDDLFSAFIEEIDADEVEDDTMNNSFHFQTHNYSIDGVNEDNDELLEQKKFTKSFCIWTEEVIKLLIAERTKFSKQFMYAKKKGQKNKLWEEIAKNILHDASKRSGGSAIKWKFYKEIEQAIEPIGKKQAMSPPRNILKESSTFTENFSHHIEPTTTGELGALTSVANSPQCAELLPTNINATLETSNTDNTTKKSSPKIVSFSSVKGKTPGWFEKYQEQKNEQANIALKNAQELHKRLDKMEKREEEMIEIQRHLVAKLDDANKIELQKLEVFKQMFNKQ